MSKKENKRNTKISKLQVRKALEKDNGMPTHAAKILNVDYSTVWRIIKDNPDLQDIRNSARAKLHEDLESLSTFAVKSGYMQKAVLGADGKPTGETTFEEVDVHHRLDQAKFLMGIYKGSVGIVDESKIDHTTNGKEIKNTGITIIELPEHLKPKSDTEEEVEQP